MDAMIFAAGLGTRLRPLTEHRPKALIEVGGRPVLEHVAARLVDAGADRIIINTHPFPQQIVQAVAACDSFGVEVLFSHETEQPLDTGGGLRHAQPLFRRRAPFFLHNCDILSDIDLRALLRAHHDDDASLATLAVLPTASDRYLIFDDHGLCGYAPRGGGDDILVRAAAGEPRRRDFAGIHVVAPEIFDVLPDDDVFSIITCYLQLARAGHRIRAFEPAAATWIDIGTHEKLAEAERVFGGGASG